MSKPSKKPRLPDPSALAFAIARVVSWDAPAPAIKPAPDAKAVERGRAGGTARAKSLGKKRKSEIGKMAAKKRWNKGTSD